MLEGGVTFLSPFFRFSLQQQAEDHSAFVPTALTLKINLLASVFPCCMENIDISEDIVSKLGLPED